MMRPIKPLTEDQELCTLWREGLSREQLERVSRAITEAGMDAPPQVVPRKGDPHFMTKPTKSWWTVPAAALAATLAIVALPPKSSQRDNPTTQSTVYSSEALDLQLDDLSLDFLQPFEFDLAGDV